MLQLQSTPLTMTTSRRQCSCVDCPWTPCSMSSKTACPDLASSRPAGAVYLTMTVPSSNDRCTLISTNGRLSGCHANSVQVKAPVF